MSQVIRCPWANVSPLDQYYHDHEWGVPVYDDRLLFENLTLEGAQAGLSWSSILKRREGYRAAFAQFDINLVAAFDQQDMARLLQNPAIIRNRLKIASVLTNARKVIEVQQEFGSFSEFIWQFVNHQPIVNHWQQMRQVPSQTEISQTMSNSLKRRGFSFVGPTICYAFMQANGLVNDHLQDCCCRSPHR